MCCHTMLLGKETTRSSTRPSLFCYLQSILLHWVLQVLHSHSVARVLPLACSGVAVRQAHAVVKVHLWPIHFRNHPLCYHGASAPGHALCVQDPRPEEAFSIHIAPRRRALEDSAPRARGWVAIPAHALVLSCNECLLPGRRVKLGTHEASTSQPLAASCAGRPRSWRPEAAQLAARGCLVGDSLLLAG